MAFFLAWSPGCKGLHFIFLAWNAIMTRSLSLIFGDKTSVFGKKENTRAIIIVASQKTLPVMVAIVGQLGGALGQVGLLVIPCVFAHINQSPKFSKFLGQKSSCRIIIDSYIGNLWLQEDKRVPYGKERLT
ncbi:probable sodium/metabolite cotransporter BASS4, chloroplastic isoform X3 [Cryptomeria japonica]|uniref:probable sodium/metabolite cotransporter BASS4, chloroplastic isoform X3 n=1 Tax=Cryptomeria japonica TaxID=3369 RepID=UPI0027D9D44E|nr:probable sodium/metabolite cotransporter BASS4, chloroplastic isoform X3 [Cryptomeria japonica]